MYWPPRYIGFLTNEVVEGAHPCETRLYYTAQLRKSHLFIMGWWKEPPSALLKWKSSNVELGAVATGIPFPALHGGSGLEQGCALQCWHSLGQSGNFQHSGKWVFLVWFSGICNRELPGTELLVWDFYKSQCKIGNPFTYWYFILNHPSVLGVSNEPLKTTAY